MDSIEISLGDGWKRDVRYLHGLRDERPADAGVDLVEIRDIVDIVVHGRNITSAVDEEHIFSLLTDLTAAVAALLEGQSRKAIVAFDSEPWELVVEPTPPDIRLTLYSVDQSRQVVIHDVAVDPDNLIDALIDAGTTLIDDLRAIAPALEQHEMSAQLRSALEKLDAWDGSWRQSLEPVDDASPIRGTTSTPTGLSLSYELSPYGPLERYGGEHPFDLHALMCAGHLWLDRGDRRIELGAGLPIFTLFDLLERIDQGIEAADEPHGLPTDLAPTGAHGNYALEVTSNRWVLRAPVLDDSDEEHPDIISVDVPASDCVEAVTTLAEMMTDDILEQNPRQTLNHRLTRAIERADDLRGWRENRSDSNLYYRHPEAYLENNAGLAAQEAAGPASPSFPWGLDSLLGAYPTTTWRLSAPRIHFDDIVSLRDLLLAPTDSGLRAIDRATGHRLWETETPRSKSRTFAVTHSAVVTNSTDAVAIRDLETGRIDCRVSHSAGRDAAGSAAQLLNAWEFDDGGDGDDRQMVLLDHRGGLKGVDRQTGDVEWGTNLETERLRDADTTGPLIAAMGERGTALGVNPGSGELLWRVQLGRTPSFGPIAHQGRLYVGTSQSNQDEFTIHALYPFTGRTRWQVRIKGRPLSRPVFHDRWLQVIRETAAGIQLVVFDLESNSPDILWRAMLASAGKRRIARPTSVRVDGIDHTIFKTPDQTLTCRRLPDGHARWNVELPAELWELHLHVPPIRVRDALLVADSSLTLRDVSNGRELQRLEGTVPAPEYLSAWGELSMVIGEGDAGDTREDRLYRIDLDRFLAEVE